MNILNEEMRKMKKDAFIISLGGSLIVPDEIDSEFLKVFSFKIMSQVSKGRKFIIITGGGKTARKYMAAAGEISGANPVERDWLGIFATRINALLVKTIFGKHAGTEIITDMKGKIAFRSPIIVASGYRPGCSTDYDSVLLAKRFNVKSIINMSNIDYVYDRDPRKFPNAKKLENVSWKNFRKLVGNKWKPGLNAPFDPVASRACERLGINVYIIGKDLDNLVNVIEGKTFRGTRIR
jgi:uridylate kinase